MGKPRRRADIEPPPPEAQRTDLLTYTEAADQLRVHPRTIRNWADSGRLVRVELSYRVQRVTQASVEELIRGGLVTST